MMKKYLIPFFFVSSIVVVGEQHLVKSITPEKFDQEVLQADLPVFFLISVSWCPPCKILKPIFEDLSIELKDQAVFVEIDVALEENRDILQRVFQNYGIIIGGFPVLFVFNQAKLINHFNARVPNKEELTKTCKQFLENIENKQ